MIRNDHSNDQQNDQNDQRQATGSAPVDIATAAPETGLRSLPAIRWLLLAGALVAGVSVYRLVQSQWSLMPVSAQYLILVAGALAIFGAGVVTRRRLRLPVAGSALLLLFTALLPVLSWGAERLRLLASPVGWIAFAAGSAALLAAAFRLLRGGLGYRGAVYPYSLAVMLAAAPVLPAAAASWVGWELGDLFYVVAALVLGMHLLAGGLDAARALAGRRGRDPGLDGCRGREPETPPEHQAWHLVPILLLAASYAGTMVLLDPSSPYLGLPVGLLGLALAAAGHREGRRPRRADGEATAAEASRRPPAALALIAAGAALVVAAVPLALRDPSLRCLALVAPCAAVLFLGWSLAEISPGAHLLGIEAAYLGAHLLPRLWPGGANWLSRQAAGLLGANPFGPAPYVCGDLGFVAALLALGFWLRRQVHRPTGAHDPDAAAAGWERLQAAHALLCALHLGGLAAMALGDPQAAHRLLAPALALAAGGVLATRRLELLVAAQAVLAAATLAVGRALLPPPDGHGDLVTAGTLTLLAGVLAALAAIGGGLEAPLATLTGRGAEAVRLALALPTAALALLSGCTAYLLLVAENRALDGVALALCGGALLLAGSRLRALQLLAAGALAVSLGVHLGVAKAAGDSSAWLPVATQALLAVSWMGVRLTRRAPAAAGPHRLEHWVANGSLIAHAALGLVWLQAALAGRAHGAWGVPVEPLVLPLAGCALLTSGIPSRRRLVLGLGGIAAWPACQLLAGGGWTDWSTSWLTALVATAPALALLIAARRELARALTLWTADWQPAAAALSLPSPQPPPSESAATAPSLALSSRQPPSPECAAAAAPALALPSRQTPPLECEATSAAVRLALGDLLRTWCGLAVASCLLFAGAQALLLAVTAVALAWLAGMALDGRGWAAALPLGLLLPALLQLAVQLPMGRAGMAPLASGGPPRLLLLVLASRRFALLPAAAAFAWGWTALAGALGRHRPPQEREPLLAVEQILEVGTAAGLLNAFLVRPALSLPGHLLLAAVAAAWAVHHLAGAVSAARQACSVDRASAPEAGAAPGTTLEIGAVLGAAPAAGAAPATAGAGGFAVVPGAARQDAWLMQAWLALGLLHGYTAGWLHFGSWAGPYVLLAAGAGLYVAGALCARSLVLRALAEPWRHGGLLLPAAGGSLALARVWGGAVPVWEPALAAFLVSAWYFAVTARESRRWVPALASAVFLGGALLAVLVRAGLGRELYFLAPGVTLLALAWLLRSELGPAWTRHLAAAGAACVYATPVVALSDQVSWIWLAALAVLTLAFGSASFAIRSRSLLLVSTAALLADLGFFVFKIGTTAPMLLWVFGLVVGLGMMLAAAYLESRRQGVWHELLRFRRGLGAWR
jgi:hypothetical protein